MITWSERDMTCNRSTNEWIFLEDFLYWFLHKNCFLGKKHFSDWWKIWKRYHRSGTTNEACLVFQMVNCHVRKLKVGVYNLWQDTQMRKPGGCETTLWISFFFSFSIYVTFGIFRYWHSVFDLKPFICHSVNGDKFLFQFDVIWIFAKLTHYSRKIFLENVHHINSCQCALQGVSFPWHTQNQAFWEMSIWLSLRHYEKLWWWFIHASLC